jgi:hypothetical protein
MLVSLFYPPTQVCERDFEFPPDFPPDARDLVDKLLAVDPADRIGEPEYTA